MASKFNIAVRDYGAELGRVGFTGTNMTPGNQAAQAGLQDALELAMGNLIIGEIATRQRVLSDETVSPDKPASKFAQRETKWLVQYTDNTTGKAYTLEIPCADLELLTGNGDKLDLTGAEGAAFKTAFEAYQLSPVGNAVTLQAVVHVGRNI